MRIIRADLHIHSCLSPCAELEMSPQAIVRTSIGKGIDMIAVCDHNSAENAQAVMEVARGTDLAVLPGMEMTSREEVHIVGLFARVIDALRVQTLVYEHLEGENDESVFGQQLVVGPDGSVDACNPRLLIGATDLPIEAIVQAVHEQDGLAVAAHIDREGFGIIGQLGFIPVELELDALEVSSNVALNEAVLKYGDYQDYPFISSSDAHALEAIGSAATPFTMESACFNELRLALRGEQGRSVCYENRG
ncbi:MAG: PHP domain-containing protein [Fidelibacterota bacterium]|nr:MAG: PHP domain-containing protein [Candidatus Neomarinimicrobiota bacterium]